MTLTLDDDILQCKLRLYNVEKLNRYAKIGIYHQEQVYSANLIERSGCYESSLVGDFDMDKDFYSALIKTDEENKPILAGGTYAGYYFNDTSVFDEEKTIDNTSQDQNSNKLSVDDITMDECEIDCDKCANCKYKEYFYSQENNGEFRSMKLNQEDDKDNLDDKETEKKKTAKPNILASLNNQFNYIFDNYPADDTLNTLINNSKFVSINESGENYSIGAIYENEDMKYICYAVKSNYNRPAPSEIGEYYQWLPLDPDDPLSDGYYIVYQDAKDLKILQV